VTEPLAEVAAAPADPGTGHAEVAATPADPGTGHAEVDAALAELGRAERLPPDQQIAAYESVHRTLQDTLRTIEQS
jgi:hypothetical protein